MLPSTPKDHLSFRSAKVVWLFSLLLWPIINCPRSLAFIQQQQQPQQQQQWRTRYHQFDDGSSHHGQQPQVVSWIQFSSRKYGTHGSYDDVPDICRRRFMVETGRKGAAATAAATLTGAVVSTTPPFQARAAFAMNLKSRTEGYEIQKTEMEWKEALSPIQYDILRSGGTEAPYSSILEEEERSGIYVCAGCGTPLFQSKDKFHSGTGWPSFARSIPERDSVEVEDVNAFTANFVGAELRCRTCGGHLGDVFNDGLLFVGTPAFSTGQRYCIDGAALIFQPSNAQEPNVSGDQSPLPKQPPSWLEPPKIIPR